MVECSIFYCTLTVTRLLLAVRWAAKLVCSLYEGSLMKKMTNTFEVTVKFRTQGESIYDIWKEINELNLCKWGVEIKCIGEPIEVDFNGTDQKLRRLQSAGHTSRLNRLPRLLYKSM